jgi:ABC-type enterochelin transport system permease subunit
MTTVGLCLSVGCLALHLAIFAATPVLRNLPAMNLASLCVALLLLYCSFLSRTAVHHEPCVTLAVVLHYSVLASFCWMLVIAFDVWQAIRRSTKKLQSSSGE